MEINRISFEVFKSGICHLVKTKGDIQFLIDVLDSGEIWKYYQRGQIPECLYLVAMVDYLSRENNVPLCTEYNQLRAYKLDKPLFPAGVIAESLVCADSEIKEEVLKMAIPEFLRFNIVEGTVRDVV